MRPSRRTTARTVVGVVLVAAAVVAVVATASFVRDRRRAAMETADEIKAKLDELDPVSRAAVRARLTADAAREITPRRRRG